MSEPKMRPLMVDGRHLGVIYTFEEGDVLPLHSHKEFDIHYSVVAEGKMSLQLPGNEADGAIIEAPLILNWQIDQVHGVTGLAKKSTLVNIFKKPVAPYV